MKKLICTLLAALLVVTGFCFAEPAASDTIVIGITGDATYLEPNAPAIGGIEIHVC